MAGINAARRLQADQLEQLACRLLTSVGVQESDATLTAHCLVDAELRELPSHGLLRLPIYIKRLQVGSMSTNGALEKLAEGPGYVLIDARYGLGPVAAMAAMEMACLKARANGIAIAIIRNASHFGCAGFFTRHAARNGFIGVSLSNSAPLLSLPGSTGAVVGNNPISIAFPGERTFVIDLALGTGTHGRILLARKQGVPIPEDWALDREGWPTTDAAEAAIAMRLQAIGGVKGFTLAIGIEALTGLLSGSDFGTRTMSMYADIAKQQSLGQTMIAIDPMKFLTADDFSSRIEELKEMLATTGNTVRLPGQRSDEAFERNRAQGIALQPDVAHELLILARELGIKTELWLEEAEQ